MRKLRDRGGEAVALVATRRDDAHCVGIDTMGGAEHPDTDSVALKFRRDVCGPRAERVLEMDVLVQVRLESGIVDRTSPSQALSRCICLRL